MIYIFQGFQLFCSLPGEACSLCGRCCNQINCRPLAQCCMAGGKAFRHFTEKPLSSFVILTFLLSVLELHACIGSLSMITSPTLRCDWPHDAPVSLFAWVLVQLNFALLNLVFAPWFQHQVWKQIMANIDLKTGLGMQPGQYVQRSVVRAAFKKVFLEDLGVLFYFLAMLASLAWSWKGLVWTLPGGPASCSGATDGLAGLACLMGCLSFGMVFLFSTCWYCCSCCASSVYITPPPADYLLNRPLQANADPAAYRQVKEEVEDNRRPPTQTSMMQP